MKKFLIFIAALLVFPVIAFADVGGPDIVSYDAYVTNPNGATYYDWDFNKKGTIDYEKKIHIFNEDVIDGKEVGEIEVKDTNKQYYVLLKDISPAKKVLTKDDAYSLKTKTTVYFYDDQELYNGPSVIYGKNGVVIPKGTTVTIKYGDAKNYIQSFAFVEYDGKSGWLPFSETIPQEVDQNFITKHDSDTDDDELLTFKKVNYYKDLTDVKTPSGTIPKGTTLKTSYYAGYKVYKKYISPFYLVDYNGEKVWVFETDGLNMVGYFGNGEKLCSNYSTSVCQLKNDIKIYDVPGDITSGNGKYIKKSEDPTKIEIVYEYTDSSLKENSGDYKATWYYVKYSSGEGWITSYNPLYEHVSNDPTVPDPEPIPEPDPEPTPDPEDDPEDDPEFVEDDSDLLKETLITVIVACGICAVGVAGLVLLNKKKKAKNVDADEKTAEVEEPKKKNKKAKNETEDNGKVNE